MEKIIEFNFMMLKNYRKKTRHKNSLLCRLIVALENFMVIQTQEDIKYL